MNAIKAAKEAAYLGPKCFGDNIRYLDLPTGFAKVRTTFERYDGSANPDTWLPD